MLLRRRAESHDQEGIPTAVRGRGSSHVTIERYLTRARGHAADLTSRTAESPGRRRSAFYESVLADSKASIRDKVRAQERIDKLLGLEDKTNQPPLEVVLGQLPATLAEPLRGLLADRVRANGSGPSSRADDGRNGLA